MFTRDDFDRAQAIVYAAMVFFQFSITDADKRQIRRAFGYYVTPALLAEIDFSTGQPPSIVREATVMASREGRINGIVEYFELGLSPGVDLSVDPAVVDEQCSWRLPVWFLPDPLEVGPEERLTLRYEYGTNNRFGRVTIRKG